jgi:hypothetical protein
VDHRAAVDAATESSASEDWDVVGSDAEDAPAGIASMGRSELSHTPERSMLDDSFSIERLDRVPMFDTGEPQYTWGHGGGRPPPTSHIYMAVLALSGNDEIHSHEVLNSSFPTMCCCCMLEQLSPNCFFVVGFANAQRIW